VKRAVHLRGVGLWAPGVDDALAWVSGRSEGAIEPKAALIPPKLARRASFLSRMVAEVAGQAAAGVDLSRVRTVHASAYGEVQTLETLLNMLHDDGVLSPARFHNSVHNTAAGHLSIATSNRAFSTTIAAGAETVSMGLLEALALLQDGGEDVLVLCADEAPGPFGLEAFQSLAVGLRLSAKPGLAELKTSETCGGKTSEMYEPPTAFKHNPVAPALALIDAVHARKSGPVLPGFELVMT
jgi:hypothetical protein